MTIPTQPNPEQQTPRIPIQLTAGVVDGTRPPMIAITIGTQTASYTFITDLQSAGELGDMFNQLMTQVTPVARAAGAGLILPGSTPAQNGHPRPV